MTSNDQNRRPVEIGIVGLDHWYTAFPLAKAIDQHPDARLAGIYDADPARATQLAQEVDAEVSTDLSTLIENDRVDVIAAYASVDQNPEICLRAAANGKHIVSIKPIARTLDEATRVLEAVHAAGVGFLPSESRARVTPFARRLRAWARDGTFGKPLTATFQMWAGLPQSWPGATDSGWFIDADRAPGGGWIDHSIYHIDLLRWVFETSVRQISGRTANLKHTELPFEDYGHAQVEFANGMQATIEDTWTAPAGAGRQSMSIVGSEGAVAYDSLTGRLSMAGSMHAFDGWAQAGLAPGVPTGIDDILDLVRGESVASVDCAWENLAACLAFYSAAENGSTVTPASPPAG